MLAVYCGYDIKDSFTGSDGTVVPKRYIARFLGLEAKDSIEFTFRETNMPKELLEIEQPGHMEMIVGDLDYSWTSALKNAYRRQYGSFKDMALLTLTKVAAKTKP